MAQMVFEYKGVYLLSAAEGSLPDQMRCPPGAEWRVSVGLKSYRVE